MPNLKPRASPNRGVVLLRRAHPGRDCRKDPPNPASHRAEAGDHSTQGVHGFRPQPRPEASREYASYQNPEPKPLSSAIATTFPPLPTGRRNCRAGGLPNVSSQPNQFWARRASRLLSRIDVPNQRGEMREFYEERVYYWMKEHRRMMREAEQLAYDDLVRLLFGEGGEPLEA